MQALLALAHRYLDAAYEMEADAFASIFDPRSSVTRLDDTGTPSVMPIDAWLGAVRTLTSPRQRGAEREDEILSIHVLGDLAVIALRLRVEPHMFTDLLSCLKVDGTWKIVQKVMTSKI